jgi:hypothetical protein
MTDQTYGLERPESAEIIKPRAWALAVLVLGAIPPLRFGVPVSANGSSAGATAPAQREREREGEREWEQHR